MSTPQQVTSRYTRNLLVKGKNNDYTLLNVLQDVSYVDTVQVGIYYKASIANRLSRGETGVGVTPEQAVQRCLQKFNVTFR
jgi:hypothetical protein